MANEKLLEKLIVFFVNPQQISLQLLQDEIIKHHYFHPVGIILTNNKSVTVMKASKSWWKTNVVKELKPTNIIIIDAKDWSFMYDSLNYLIKLMSQSLSKLVLLTPYLIPPKIRIRYDNDISSFACSYAFFSNCIKNKVVTTLERLSFEILLLAMRPDSCVRDLLVKQLPIDEKVQNLAAMDTSNQLFNVMVVIPHRGELNFVKTCINYIKNNHCQPEKLVVCFDEAITPAHKNLIKQHETIEFCHTQPHGVGPYVSRQCISFKTNIPYIIFQDSDDVPTSDRFQQFKKYVENNQVDLLGSHEIRLDELREAISVFRYPLDVYEALSTETNHPLLHPASMINKQAFLRSGGFSTVRKFSSDTQFLLRAYFYLKRIQNIDEFLYIRRHHPNSLTTNPETGFGTTKRGELESQWREDFDKIKRGVLALGESSLALEQDESHGKVVPM